MATAKVLRVMTPLSGSSSSSNDAIDPTGTSASWNNDASLSSCSRTAAAQQRNSHYHYASFSTVDGDEQSRSCRSCRSIALRVDYSQGDRVCTNCGMVAEERILDDRPEWREFLNDADDLAKKGCGTTSVARSGLVPVDESLYIGGLQPTTLSRHVFGGSSSSGPDRSSSSSRVRQRLMAASRRIDSRMVKLSAKSLEAVRLHHSLQIQTRKRRRNGATSDETDHDEEYDNDNHHNSSDSDLRPEYENLVLQEEEDASRVQAALYADKWSLSRAIQLFGTDHEVSLLEHKDESLLDDGEWNVDGATPRTGTRGRRLDSTLKQASQDLYRAYTMLVQSARRLHLPERVEGEAVHWLYRYAARRDGLTVRGVASSLTRRPNDSSSGSATAAANPRHERMARAALGEYNKMKQAGALSAALLYYTCRCAGWARPIEEICTSIQPLAMLNDHPSFKADPNEPFIKKKHCSRAMNEVKEVFPDFVQKSASLPATGQPKVSPSLSSLPSTTAPSDTCNLSAVSNFVDHKVRHLHLPPVAEAVIRAMLCHWQHYHSYVDDLNQLSTVCAALTLFVCHSGAVMQRLAQHASKATSKRRKLVAADHPDREDTSSHFDVFDCSSGNRSDSASDKQIAYEMGKVWDAWIEQLPWSRSLVEVEQSFRLSSYSIMECYRKKIFPQRSSLLEKLRQSVVVESASIHQNDSCLDNAFLSLKGTPLSSVLLQQIHIVSSLLNEDARQTP